MRAPGGPGRARIVTSVPRTGAQCGEAIGAIGRPESLPLMEEFAKDGRPEVSETCALAAARLRWTMVSEAAAPRAAPRPRRDGCGGRRLQDGKSEDDSSADNPYQSVDPAPAEDKDDEDGKSDAPSRVEALRARLMDAELPLFQRYRAMFSLRNMQTTEAVLVRRGVPSLPRCPGPRGAHVFQRVPCACVCRR